MSNSGKLGGTLVMLIITIVSESNIRVSDDFLKFLVKYLQLPSESKRHKYFNSSSTVM